MLRIILIFLGLSLIPNALFARLGEVEKENEQRFGNSVENVNDKYSPILRQEFPR